MATPRFPMVTPFHPLRSAAALPEREAPQILPAHPVHLPAIARLAETVWRAHYPEIISEAQIAYMLERMYALPVLERDLTEGIEYLRLVQGETLVGFAAFGPGAQPGDCKLHKLYIHSGQQRRGWGGLLLRRIEAEARLREFQTLILSVNKANHQALAAYQKYGFKPREAVVVDIGNGFVMDDFVLEKPLRPETGEASLGG